MYRIQKLLLKNISITLVVILISALSILANLLDRSFTSDDVAVQNAAHNLLQAGPHTILQGYNTFVLKIPIYLLIKLFISPGRTALILEALLFNVSMIVLLVIYWRKIIVNSRYRWLVFIWMIADGVFWLSHTINLNDRNIDLAIMLLASLWIIKNVGSLATLSKRQAPYLIIASFLSGLLIYEDPYYLFFILIPLIIAVFCHYIRNLKVIVLSLISLFISLISRQLIQLGLQHIGLGFAKVSQTNAITSALTPLSELPHKTLQVLDNYLYLMGASPSYIKSDVWMTPLVVLNLMAICLAITGLYLIISRRLYSLINLWIISTIMLAFGYLIITAAPILDTYHYLIILVPITALLVTVVLSQSSKAKSVKKNIFILAVISLSIFFNTLNAVVTIDRTGHTARPNNLDYQIISTVDKTSVNKIYGNYWTANIVYYLSGYKDNVLPTICYNGQVYLQPLLFDTQRLNVSSKNVGILVTPSLIIPTQSPYPQSPSCTLEATLKQFGSPKKTIPIQPDTYLLIYGHRINLRVHI